MDEIMQAGSRLSQAEVTNRYRKAVLDGDYVLAAFIRDLMGGYLSEEPPYITHLLFGLDDMEVGYADTSNDAKNLRVKLSPVGEPNAPDAIDTVFPLEGSFNNVWRSEYSLDPEAVHDLWVGLEDGAGQQVWVSLRCRLNPRGSFTADLVPMPPNGASPQDAKGRPSVKDVRVYSWTVMGSYPTTYPRMVQMDSGRYAMPTAIDMNFADPGGIVRAVALSLSHRGAEGPVVTDFEDRLDLSGLACAFESGRIQKYCVTEVDCLYRLDYVLELRKGEAVPGAIVFASVRYADAQAPGSDAAALQPRFVTQETWTGKWVPSARSAPSDGGSVRKPEGRNWTVLGSVAVLIVVMTLIIASQVSRRRSSPSSSNSAPRPGGNGGGVSPPGRQP